MDDRSKESERGLRFVNPPGLYDPVPNGYSHLALVPPGWRVAYAAGQGGETADGVLADDFGTQLRQAFANVRMVLAAAAADASDVARLAVLVVDHSEDKLQLLNDEVARMWGDHPRPAITLIPVPRLALDGMLVEVEATAVLPG